MEAFLMVIYPPNQRSNATFEQPKWAQNNTVEHEVSYTETPLQYEVSPIDSPTSTPELTQIAFEQAADQANVTFIMQVSDAITKCRELVLSEQKDYN